jgi:hypothetical protein
MYPAREALPYLDKTIPEAWKAATVYGTAVSDEALRQGWLVLKTNSSGASLTAQRMLILP